jgi:hypothetical protein
MTMMPDGDRRGSRSHPPTPSATFRPASMSYWIARDALDLEEKRLLFRDLGLRVTVQPDRSVQIDALIPVPERVNITDPPTATQTPWRYRPPFGRG